MREFKFRAWSKNVNQMFTVVKINFSSGAVWFKDASYIGNIGKHDVLLLQYTGLHDKHGKEIYEGDILKDKEFILLVKVDCSHAYRFMLEMNTKAQSYYEMLSYNQACNMKVIGNIHKNPELLKQ